LSFQAGPFKALPIPVLFEITFQAWKIQCQKIKMIRLDTGKRKIKASNLSRNPP
jgi:hypothetical protein